jgi:hypothetical protein
LYDIVLALNRALGTDLGGFKGTFWIFCAWTEPVPVEIQNVPVSSPLTERGWEWVESNESLFVIRRGDQQPNGNEISF